MDMNIALNELREAIDELQCMDLSDEGSSASSIEAVIGQFRNFDELLSSGSPLPAAWANRKKTVISDDQNLSGEQLVRLFEEAQQAGALKFEVNTVILDPNIVKKFESLGAKVCLDAPSNFCSIKWGRSGK
jgi:hypothetical protein